MAPLMGIPVIQCPQTFDPCPALNSWLSVSGDLLIILSGVRATDTIVMNGPGFPRDLGWTDKDLYGQPWTAFAHPEDIPLTQQMMLDLTPGVVQSFTNRWRHKQNLPDATTRWVWLEWAILHVAQFNLVYAHARNMTNRFEREAQMATWSRITSDLMAVADTAVPILERKFEWVNEAWTRHLGWSVPAIYDITIVDLLHPLEKEPIIANRTLREQSPALVEDEKYTCKVRSQDGKYLTYEWSSVVLNGKIYTVGRDVEAELHHRDELQSVITDLEVRNADLEKFASVTAHQLRSPPRTIAGIAQALQEDYGHLLDAAGLQFLADIREDADQMSEIVDGLYRFSKVRTAEDLVLDNIDLNVLLQDIKADKIKKDLMREGDNLTWDHLPTVRGTKVLLHEVLSNLICNGLKFNESESKRIHVKAEPREDGRWTILVTDNGIGIDPKYHNKLFQMFQRVHTHYRGTGVGLAVVEAIIRKMDGEVGVRSQVGKGSTFFFDLAGAET